MGGTLTKKSSCSAYDGMEPRGSLSEIRRLRASARGLPFKCKGLNLAMGGNLLSQEKSRM